jgi:hypothetical protein
MGISARAVTGHIRRGLSSLQAAHSSAAPSSTATRNAGPAVVRRLARPADLPGYGDQRTRGE